VVTNTETALGDADYAEHLRTYRYFVLFAAHALLILLLLYYFVA
jgi:hypothetical protein